MKIEFIEYKIANDISRFFEDISSEKSDEVLGSKLRVAFQGNILYINYIDWLKKQQKAGSKLKLKSKNK